MKARHPRLGTPEYLREEGVFVPEVATDVGRVVDR